MHTPRQTLASITASVFLDLSLLAFCTSGSWSFFPAHSSSSSSVGEGQWTAEFQYSHRLGHCNKCMFSGINHLNVAEAVCLGSLSCWKVNLHTRLKSPADWNRIFVSLLGFLYIWLHPSCSEPWSGSQSLLMKNIFITKSSFILFQLLGLLMLCSLTNTREQEQVYLYWDPVTL